MDYTISTTFAGMYACESRTEHPQGTYFAPDPWCGTRYGSHDACHHTTPSHGSQMTRRLTVTLSTLGPKSGVESSVQIRN